MATRAILTSCDTSIRPRAWRANGGARVVLLPARQSSCASVYTTAAEMLARWCAKNELSDVRAVPYCAGGLTVGPCGCDASAELQNLRRGLPTVVSSHVPPCQAMSSHVLLQGPRSQLFINIFL